MTQIAESVTVQPAKQAKIDNLLNKVLKIKNIEQRMAAFAKNPTVPTRANGILCMILDVIYALYHGNEMILQPVFSIIFYYICLRKPAAITYEPPSLVKE